MRVLVAGATGYLGGCVGRELKRRGHGVRALVRREEQRAAVRGFADEVVVAHVTRPSTRSQIASGAMQFVTGTSAVDMVAPPVGTERLRDYFESMVGR